MLSIPKTPHEKKRFFRGYPACVGFEVDADCGVVWCAHCKKFHSYKGMSSNDVQNSCPRIPDGAKTLILFCGSAPLCIRRAEISGKLDRDARRTLDVMLNVLDVLISSEEAPV